MVKIDMASWEHGREGSFCGLKKKLLHEKKIIFLD
jgi:hypothetical protein